MRGLAVASVVCALLALWVAATGGGALDIGAFRLISARTPKNPLLAAIVLGLIAWALALASAAPLERRHRRGIGFAAASGALVLALNAYLLAQPAPPPDVDNCLFETPLGWGFRHLVNCDSPEFLALAFEPSLVFTHTNRQGRPLSFGWAYAVARPLRWIFPRLTMPGPLGERTHEFVAYVLINVVLLVCAFLCFTWVLEAGTGCRAGPELLCGLVALGANDVTKLFFWTPHVQIFNLVIPCLSVYLAFRLLERQRALTPVQALGLGGALGIGLLTYGSFVIPLAVAGLIQLAAYRRLLPAVVTGVAAVAPYAAWMAMVTARTGSFYNHEVAAYRQFIWMGDCAAAGVDACLPVVAANFRMFFNTAAPVVAIPLLLVVLSVMANQHWGQPVAVLPARRALQQSIALTFVITLTFLALMGFYVPRLAWLLVPPLVLAIVLEVQGIVRAQRVSARWLALAAVALSLTHLLTLAARQGPYQ